MREKFIDKKFSRDKLEIIDQINAIVHEMQAAGYTMTLRQLYYLFIGRDLLPESWIDVEYNEKNGLPPDTKNTERSYSKLGDILSDARLAGAVDWAAFEDRVRVPHAVRDWPDIVTAAEERIAEYRLPRWEGQPRYVECWSEKDALAGIIEPIAFAHHATFVVCKGYNSTQALYDAAKRYIYQCAGAGSRTCPACEGYGACTQCEGEGELLAAGPVFNFDAATFTACPKCNGTRNCSKCSGSGSISERRKEPWLLYVGDHDPSGEDMVRDIKDRMLTFGVDGIRVVKIALTMRQIERYRLPPNPAKVTDSRAVAYIEKHGDRSWEVDALPPPVLTEIVRNAFARVIDRAKMDAIIEREEIDRARLRKVVARLGE